MIHFVTTRSHASTVSVLVKLHGRRRCRCWCYEHVFHQRSLPSGTWIFTDHERLSSFELALAGQVATSLEAGGARVLNHPARVYSRLEILRRLRAAGLNQFSAWPADAAPRPDAFPVFIRNAFDHSRRQIELLPDLAALDAALRRLKAKGTPLTGKLVIEYAGEPCNPGLWQRLASWRVAEAVIAHHRAIDTSWLVKDGLPANAFSAHPARSDFVAVERDFVTGNRHVDIVRAAFDIAGIEYGRADFALVGGRPQIYEINTNPNHTPHGVLARDTHPDRIDIQMASENRLQEAILAIDTPAAGPIRLRGSLLTKQQRWSSRLAGTLRRP